MAKENSVVRAVQEVFKKANRCYINVHGDMYSKSGTADIISMDNNGTYVAIEVKNIGGKVYPNQYDFLEEVLKNNGRAIVVFDDVKNFKNELVEKIDNHLLPLHSIELGRKKTPQKTFELTLENNISCEYEELEKDEEELLDELINI